MKALLNTLIIAIFSGLLSMINAQEPVLLKDFDTTNVGTFRYNQEIDGITLNNQFIFMVDHLRYGKELWRTDGTAAGTQLLRDIAPNEEDPGIWFLGVFNDFLFFRANDGIHGRELWYTRGTPATTQMIDINPGPGDGSPSHMVFLNGYYYFKAQGEFGTELYRMPENSFVPELVKDIHPGTGSNGYPNSSSPNNLVVLNDQILFKAYSPETNVELWRTTGEAETTELVKDINPGSNGSLNFSGDSYLGEDYFYFTAYTDSFGIELWRTDGTIEGTIHLTESNEPNSSNRFKLLEEVNGMLFYTAYESGDRILWQTDGSPDGEFMVEGGLEPGEYIFYRNLLIFEADNDIWITNGQDVDKMSEIRPYSPFVSAGDYVYFISRQGLDGNGLWKIDFIADTVELVKEVTDRSYYDMENLKGIGQHVYFTAETDSFGNELWVSDGTQEGTFMLLDMLPGEEDGMYKYDEVTYGNIGNTLFFTGTDTIHGRELWLTEGTTESTRLVKDLTTQTGDIILRQEMQSYKGSMYFTTNYGLWKSDGTTESTSLIKSFEYCNGLNLFNGLLYFTARDTTISTVWTSDGSTEGTQPFLSQVINDHHSAHLRENMPQINGNMYMSVRDSLGEELWKTDGTVEGTERVKDIYEGEFDGISALSTYAVLDDVLYFTANDGLIGNELWRSDGTEEGTYAVYDINPFGHSYCRNYITMGDAVYFAATKDDLGYELWKTDGTNAGTRLVKEIRQGEGNGFRNGEITSFNNTLFFNANDGMHGGELWKSDGTEDGTTMVKDIGISINYSYYSSNPESFSIINNQLYFRARDTVGYRIWTTDGTEEGTFPVLEDILTDHRTRIIRADDKIFFNATTDEHGTELWWADTNFSNPSLVKDIYSGGFSSEPIIEGFKNGTLYFRATEDKYGRELYALSPLDYKINMLNLTDTYCSPQDTIELQATTERSDVVAAYQWYVNNNLVNTSEADVLQKAGFEDGDEIQVKAIAVEDYWVKNKSMSSSLLTIKYDVPVAELSLSGNVLTATGGESYTWFLDNEPLEFTGQSFTVEENGTYQVEVTNDSGCKALSSSLAVVFETVGLSNISKNPHISVYPNPTKGYVHINSIANNDLEEYRVIVRNAAGVVVSESTVSDPDNQIFIGNKPGFYLIQVIDQHENKVAYFKILVN